jgi:hypothetical protein
VYAKTASNRDFREEVQLQSIQGGTAARSWWARARVREMEDAYARSPTEQIERAIVRHSLEHRVLCRFTAFLAIEQRESVGVTSHSHAVTQPVELPRAWASPDLAQRLYGGGPPRSAPIFYKRGKRPKPPRDLTPAACVSRLQELSEQLDNAAAASDAEAVRLCMASLSQLIRDARACRIGPLWDACQAALEKLLRFFDDKPPNFAHVKAAGLRLRQAFDARESLRLIPPSPYESFRDHIKRWFWK